jgi:hypothetical protein
MRRVLVITITITIEFYDTVSVKLIHHKTAAQGIKYTLTEYVKPHNIDYLQVGFWKRMANDGHM